MLAALFASDFCINLAIKFPLHPMEVETSVFDGIEETLRLVRFTSTSWAWENLPCRDAGERIESWERCRLVSESNLCSDSPPGRIDGEQWDCA